MYALMGLTDAAIIAFVIYPIAYFSMENGAYNEFKREITDDEFQEKADILQKEFQIPVSMLGEQRHISSLCQTVIEYFKNQHIERIANRGENQNETKNETLVGMQKEA